MICLFQGSGRYFAVLNEKTLVNSVTEALFQTEYNIAVEAIVDIDIMQSTCFFCYSVFLSYILFRVSVHVDECVTSLSSTADPTAVILGDIYSSQKLVLLWRLEGKAPSGKSSGIGRLNITVGGGGIPNGKAKVALAYQNLQKLGKAERITQEVLLDNANMTERVCIHIWER